MMIIRWNWSTVPHVGVQIHAVSYHCCFYLPSYPSVYIPQTFGIKWLVSYPHLWVFLGYLKPSCCFSPGFYHQMFQGGSHPKLGPDLRHLGCQTASPTRPRSVALGSLAWLSRTAPPPVAGMLKYWGDGVNPLQTPSLSIDKVWVF